jgi:hypothetical protein
MIADHGLLVQDVSELFLCKFNAVIVTGLHLE